MGISLDQKLEWARLGYDAAGLNTLKWEDVERKIKDLHAGNGSSVLVGAIKPAPPAASTEAIG